MWKHLNSIKCEVCKTSEYYDLFLKVVFLSIECCFWKYEEKYVQKYQKIKRSIEHILHCFQRFFRLLIKIIKLTPCKTHRTPRWLVHEEPVFTEDKCTLITCRVGNECPLKVCVIKHFCHFQFSLRQQFSQGVCKYLGYWLLGLQTCFQRTNECTPAEKKLKGNVGMMHIERMFRSLTRGRKIRSFSPHFSSLCKNQNVINRGCGIYKLTTVQVERLWCSP